ncbi:STAS/SEC14 domain-containing protein [bacterium]|nr:STAS/SEC14 domain-containing protein [bacterium]MBU1650685.1 STAS/SEC14 domain-containing protein [bacterium]
MPTEIKYLSGEKIVLIKHSGIISAAELRENTIEAARLVKEHGTTRILADNSDMVTSAKTIDLFELPKIYDELGVSKASKIAIVMNLVDGRKDMYQFYETVCRNRGYDVRLFADEESAMNWLQN